MAYITDQNGKQSDRPVTHTLQISEVDMIANHDLSSSVQKLSQLAKADPRNNTKFYKAFVLLSRI
jgi:hypothetical protein